MESLEGFVSVHPKRTSQDCSSRVLGRYVHRLPAREAWKAAFWGLSPASTLPLLVHIGRCCFSIPCKAALPLCPEHALFPGSGTSCRPPGDGHHLRDPDQPAGLLVSTLVLPQRPLCCESKPSLLQRKPRHVST